MQEKIWPIAAKRNRNWNVMNNEVPNKIDVLKELVRKHKVCWESWPEFYLDAKGQRIQIGFELDLVGIHDHPAHLPAPGCDECVNVYEDLRQIALDHA
jgi:hypothetical protein